MGRRAAMMGMWALSLAVVSAWLGGAGGHLWDRREITHVSGAWMGLAWWTNQGVFYPPLVDSEGEHFGGTRFAPLPIVAHAGMARATGEYVGSGKLLNMAGVALLMGAVAFGVRGCGAPWGLGVLAASVLVVTRPGWTAGTSIRFDAWSAGLQMWAVVLVTWGRGRGFEGVGEGSGGSLGRALGAGAMCGLAWVCKVSGLWGVAALGAWWVLQRRWRSAGWLLVGWAVTAGVLWGLFEWWSGGRMSENLLLLSMAGEPSGGLRGLVGGLRGLHRAWWDSPEVYGLMPVMALGAWVMWRRGVQGVWVVAMVMWGMSAVVIFSSPGAASNHLIDGAALGLVPASGLWGAWRGEKDGQGSSEAWGGMGGVLAGLSLAWALWGGAQNVHVVRYGREGLAQWRTDWTAGQELAELRRAVGEGVVLSQDPSVPVKLGLDVVMLDAFMFKRIAAARPGAAAGLVERMRRGEIEKVVLIERMDSPAWAYYAGEHFGPGVIEAMGQWYEFETVVQDRAVYRWRGDGGR